MTINNKGFTLIELLVVIAIIGILSGLIIVSMSGANNSAKDATVQAHLDQMRTVAELYKAQNSSYGTNANAISQTDCTNTGDSASTFIADTPGDFVKLCTQLIANDGTSGTTIKIEDGDSGATKYCIASDLNTGTGAWCVDYTGVSKAVTAITVCDATHLTCASD